MPYFSGNPDYDHKKPNKTGILVVNLGTPDAPEKGALRRYLGEFLSDRRVVELPRALWLPLLHLIILNTRPKKSAEAYKSIWVEEKGSPLMIHSQAIADKIGAQYGDDTVTLLAMRYGTPSIKDALESMRKQQVDKLIVLPLYPQYAAATTGSIFDAVSKIFQRWRWVPEFHFISSYYQHQAFIDAKAAHIQDYWDQHGKKPFLMMSFHGIPKPYFLKGDPYYCHCVLTARGIAAKLNLDDDSWMMTFQSRFGKQEWLKPYTDHTLQSLPKERGIKDIDVVCPGFAADCLETLEEIAVENQEYFMEAGGESYRYIPCLNESERHIEALKHIIDTHGGL